MHCEHIQAKFKVVTNVSHKSLKCVRVCSLAQKFLCHPIWCCWQTILWGTRGKLLRKTWDNLISIGAPKFDALLEQSEFHSQLFTLSTWLTKKSCASFICLWFTLSYVAFGKTFFSSGKYTRRNFPSSY